MSAEYIMIERQVLAGVAGLAQYGSAAKYRAMQKVSKFEKYCKTTSKPEKTNARIHLEITEDLFGGFGLRARLGRSQTLLLARSALVRADLKIFGGPRGASSALFRSNWVFGGPRGTAHAPVRKPRRRFERAFLFKQGFQRPFRHFRRVF